MTIDIRGLDKAAVLAALYNRSRPQGMGITQAKLGDMPVEEARALLADDRPKKYFDYLFGRVLKVDLTGDEFEEYLYDRDLGAGAAAAVIAAIRERGT